jgi:hypothetical protein
MDKTLNELLVSNSKKSKKELIEICLNYYKNKNDSLCKETNFLVSNIRSAMRKIDIFLNQDELKFLINSSRNVEKEYHKTSYI